MDNLRNYLLVFSSIVVIIETKTEHIFKVIHFYNKTYHEHFIRKL